MDEMSPQVSIKNSIRVVRALGFPSYNWLEAARSAGKVDMCYCTVHCRLKRGTIYINRHVYGAILVLYDC